MRATVPDTAIGQAVPIARGTWRAFEAQLTEVDFQNNHTMKSDPTVANPSGVAYNSIEWQNSTTDPTTTGVTTSVPGVAYSSGLASANDRMQVAAKFVITDGFIGNPKVRAFASNGTYNIAATAATASGGGSSSYDILTLAATFATADFNVGAEYLNDFQLLWQISDDNGTHWVTVGVSTHDVYVTYKDPTGPMYHTVVHVGTIGAAGYLTDAGVIGGIWGQFSDRVVMKWDGSNQLGYSHPPSPATNTADLLIDNTGECSAWVNFFADTLGLQGIEIDAFVKIDAAFNPPFGYTNLEIIVKNWDFYGTELSTYLSPWGFDWIMDENCEVGIGKPGQNASNPLKIFSHHWIVRIGSTIYDPSYGGQTYADADAWICDNLEGVGIWSDYNGETSLYISDDLSYAFATEHTLAPP